MAKQSRNVLYLVRHGESMGNVTRRLLSPADDVLTDTGKAQAFRLGEHFADIRWTHAYSSDYPRAVDTALGILSKSRNCSDPETLLKRDGRIRERHYGDLEGRSYREGFQTYYESVGSKPSSLLSILEFEMKNGEPVAATVARMFTFFRELFDRLDSYQDTSEGEGASVLVVSHSFALVAFMHALSESQTDAGAGAGDTPPEFRLLNWNREQDLKMMRNVSYMEIGIGVKEPSGSSGSRELDFIRKHETSHLDGLSTHGTFSNFAQESREASQFSGCVQQ